MVSGVPKESSWMSPVVAPSPFPGASSGSLLVADTSMTCAAGSHASLTCHAACTGTIRWFGGQARVGFTDRASAGGVVSTTVTGCWQLDLLPCESETVQVTTLDPVRSTSGASSDKTSDGSQPASVTGWPRFA